MPEGKVRIALDAMGGDFAPAAVVEGAILAQKGYNGDFEIVLVGEEEKIKKELTRLQAISLPFIIQHASEQINMEDLATEGLRKKKDSSIAVALRMQKEGRVDAFVSGGNTGVVMATAFMTLGRLEGVNRPAIATYIPSEKDVVLVLDVGANADCKAQNLYEFGVMGSIYYNYVLKKENPRVGLLSIGEESTKGNEVTVGAHKLLNDGNINFVGNVEGRDILKGVCDVVVCDGFIGNIVLKFVESIGGFMTSLVRRQINSSFLFRIGALLLKWPLRNIRKTLDFAEYGGAPLLGVEGVCIICHGESPPKAIMNALKMASEMVRGKVNQHIKEKLLAQKVKLGK